MHCRMKLLMSSDLDLGCSHSRLLTPDGHRAIIGHTQKMGSKVGHRSMAKYKGKNRKCYLPLNGYKKFT